MPKRRGPLGALVAFLTLGVLLLGAPALSQETTDRFGVSISPVRVEFFVDPPEPEFVTVFVKGGSRGTVGVTMFDILPDPEGGFQRTEYGSTPPSLDGFLNISPTTFPYIPDGTEQQFTLRLDISPEAADRVFYGTLVATFAPEGAGDSEGASIAAGVGIQILTAQAADEIPPAELALELDSLDVRAREPWTVLDRLLPDIPSVVGHGPAIMEAAGRNVGEYFLDEVTVFEVRRVSPLVLLPFVNEGEPRPILRVSMTPRYTLPGQSFSDETTTLIPLDGGGEVDALPFIGFVRVTARATGTLGGVEAQGDARSKTVLVVPWSEGLFLFAAWGLLRGRRRRGHAEAPVVGLRRRAERGVTKRFGGGPDDPEPPGPSPDQLPLF